MTGYDTFDILAGITNKRQAGRISDVSTPHTLHLDLGGSREWYVTAVRGQFWTLGFDAGAKYLCRCIDEATLRQNAKAAESVSVLRESGRIPPGIASPPDHLKPTASDGGSSGGYSDHRAPGHDHTDWFGVEEADE
jgi:hypothetical protein